MEAQRKRWTKWLLALAKFLLFSLLCWFIYRTYESGNKTLSDHVWHVDPSWLVLSGFLYLLGLLPAALFWQRVCISTGQDIKLGESLRAYYISQLGKYVPGKWMVILLRRVMLHTRHVETTVIAASVFFETLLMLAVGSAMAALVLLIWHRDQTLLILTAAGSTVLLGVPTIPIVFQWLIRMLGVGKLNPTAGAKFMRIGWRTISLGCVGMACGWLLQGMSLWATLRGLEATSGGPFDNLSLHTAAVSLAVVAGFLSQIPGGLAVREWVSGELLEPLYGPGMAMISAIIFRLVLLVSELVISIILYAVGWRRLRKPAAAVGLS